MKFDAAHAIEAYADVFQGEQFVLYPSSRPTRLLVCFAAMDARESFNRLYLRDTAFSNYLGNDATPKHHTYLKIIDKVLQQSGLDRDKALTVGSSMGGYAAILYAFQMALAGAVVGVPQVNKSCARMHRHANWIRGITASESQWLELDECLYRPDPELPRLYLEYGCYPADLEAAERLLAVYRERGGFVIAHKSDSPEHASFMSAASIRATAQYMFSAAAKAA